MLQEVIRLHPPVPGDSKEAVRDDVLPDGTKVPKGAGVMYRPYLFGRSPLLWKDPLRFDPQRFMGKKPSQFKYIAFNAGPRLCLGMNLALLVGEL